MKYDLLIKGGVVVDPAQGINGLRDVGIFHGQIVDVDLNLSGSEAKKVIPAKGLIVTPGLIDIHAHVASDLIPSGTTPDAGGVAHGVTTICDGGSTGHATFKGFKKFVVPQAETEVLCFLNIVSTGMAVMPEVWGWHDLHPKSFLEKPFTEQNPRLPYCFPYIDPQATLKTAEENRGIIKGIKFRAIGTIAKYLGLDAMRVAKKIAVEAGLPLMVHIGIDEGGVLAEETGSYTREVLPLMGKGDILAHVFTWKRGGILKEDGTVISELRDVASKGVFLDVCHGKRNFSFKTARRILDQGIVPDIISTDLNNTNLNETVFSLVVTMSKLIALGFTLDQVVRMTTINPARALKEEHQKGSLKEGMPADISILEMVEGDYVFSAGDGGDTLRGNRLLVPKITIKSGREIPALPMGYLPR